MDPEREKGKREKEEKVTVSFFFGRKTCLERKNRKEDKRKRKSTTRFC